MDLHDVIEWEQYEKISDDVYFLGTNLVLRFSVVLARYGTDGKRYHFHKEIGYRVQKSGNSYMAGLIRRSFDYYLSIENQNRTKDGEKEFIRIGVSEFIAIRNALQEAALWFTDSKYEKLYVRKNSKLIMTSPIPKINIPGLPMNKYLRLEPCIIAREVGDDYSEPGVIMYLSSEINYVKMNINRFMGLVYLFESINMYQSAQIMLNYLGRPELGTNMYCFDPIGNSNYESDIEKVEVKKANRKVVPMSQKGLGSVEV